MWLKFLEYNNKYLKCLATVRLINKLFTTPQYIEEKLLVVLLGTLLDQPESSSDTLIEYPFNPYR